MVDKKGLNSVERIIYHWVYWKLKPQLQIVTDDTKNKSKDILSIEQVRNIFNSYWYMSYYDFYFIRIENFKRIIIDNNLSEYFNKNSWEKFNHVTLKWIEKFSRYLWFNRFTFDETKQYILDKLNLKWIKSIKELLSYWLYNLKNDFSTDKVFLYFFKDVLKKSLWKIVYDEFILFWNKVWLCELSYSELKTLIIEVLNKKNINYQEDLDKIDVYTFRSTLWNNLLIEYYFFYIKKISRTKVFRKDIIEFWQEIWLKNQNKKEMIKNWIKDLLYTNNIRSYEDLRTFWRFEIRSILWSNEACKTILKELWLDNLSDFRINHLNRFARRIWLPWVPNDFEYDEEKSKKLLVSILRTNWVKSIYCLEFYWIKNIKKLLRKKNNKYFQDISTYIMGKLWKTIPNLNQEDLEKLGNSLSLPSALNEIEYKNMLLSFLSMSWFSLDSINSNIVRANSHIWNNSSFRYFIEQIWLKSDLSKLRKEHIDALKDYIQNIKS